MFLKRAATTSFQLCLSDLLRNDNITTHRNSSSSSPLSSVHGPNLCTLKMKSPTMLVTLVVYLSTVAFANVFDRDIGNLDLMDSPTVTYPTSNAIHPADR